MTKQFWTSKRREHFRELCDRYPDDIMQVAREMGLTKNAAIGMRWRMQHSTEASRCLVFFRKYGEHGVKEILAELDKEAKTSASAHELLRIVRDWFQKEHP